MRPTFATVSLAILAAPLFTGCLSIRGSEPASIGASVGASSAYWFRGSPVNTGGVLQGDMAMSIPLADDGLLDLTAWGNMALTGDSGGGSEPDGNGLSFTEVDLEANYTRSYDGYDLNVGLVSYNFPNGIRRTTSEVFAGASFAALGFTHALTMYFDFEALDGFYFSYAGGWSKELDERTQFDAGLMLGAMGGDQAVSYFGIDANGLSDLALSGTVSRAFDAATTVSTTLAYIMAIDSGYRDALSARGLDDNGFVLSVGAAWSF